MITTKTVAICPVRTSLSSGVFGLNFLYISTVKSVEQELKTEANELISAANSPAARVGLRPGDLITRVNNTDVNSAEAAQNALAKADASNGISLYVTNRDGSQFVFVPAEILKGQ